MKKAFILQPRIQHYRVPVFDELRARGAKHYGLEVWGPLRDGQAIGGGRRDYFHALPLKQAGVGGRQVEWWPAVRQHIVRSKADVVITPVYPSNLSSWVLPWFCRERGIACIGWGKVYGKSSNLLTTQIKQWLFTHFDRMLVYGNRSLDELRTYGYPADRVYVTKNTIDTQRIFDQRDHYAKQAEELRHRHRLQEATILLCIAKFEPGKRHQDLFAAWPFLRQLDPHLHLVLIGSGRLESEIVANVERLDPERIHCMGRVPVGEDYAWIAASDVTIQCGAVGLAVNQSLAFGKPTVIADEVSPDTEALQDGINGWRYMKGDAQSLVDAISLVLRDPDRSRTVAENGPDMVKNNFSIGNMVGTIDQCILDALRLKGHESI